MGRRCRFPGTRIAKTVLQAAQLSAVKRMGILAVDKDHRAAVVLRRRE